MAVTRLPRGTNANSGSVVPSGGGPKGSSLGSNKKLKGTNPQAQSVVPRTTSLPKSVTRGGPAKKAPKGKGVVASGGGSFGQN